MKTLAVGEFKTRWSKKEKVAVVIPYEKTPVRLGVMEGIASCRVREYFKMTNEGFWAS